MTEKKNSTRKKAAKKAEEVKVEENAQVNVVEQTKGEIIIKSENKVTVNEGENAKQFVDRLKSELGEYSKEVDGINEVPVLQAMFDEVSVQSEKYAAVLNQKQYKLPENVTYEGKTYDMKQISVKVSHFISQQSVKFGDVATIREICRNWIEIKPEMGYRIYDMSVGILNNCDYKGMREWEDILIISAYLQQIGEEYTVDSFTETYWNTKKQTLENRARELQSK